MSTRHLLLCLSLLLLQLTWSSVQTISSSSTNRSYVYEPWNSSHRLFNLVLNKVPKCASSSVGGVVRTIAHYRDMTNEQAMLKRHLLRGSAWEQARFTSKALLRIGHRRNNHGKNSGFPEPFVLATHSAKQQWRSLDKLVCSVLIATALVPCFVD